MLETPQERHNLFDIFQCIMTHIVKARDKRA